MPFFTNVCSIPYDLLDLFFSLEIDREIVDSLADEN